MLGKHWVGPWAALMAAQKAENLDATSAAYLAQKLVVPMAESMAACLVATKDDVTVGRWAARTAANWALLKVGHWAAWMVEHWDGMRVELWADQWAACLVAKKVDQTAER